MSLALCPFLVSFRDSCSTTDAVWHGFPYFVSVFNLGFPKSIKLSWLVFGASETYFPCKKESVQRHALVSLAVRRCVILETAVVVFLFRELFGCFFLSAADKSQFLRSRSVLWPSLTACTQNARLSWSARLRLCSVPRFSCLVSLSNTVHVQDPSLNHTQELLFRNLVGRSDLRSRYCSFVTVHTHAISRSHIATGIKMMQYVHAHNSVCVRGCMYKRLYAAREEYQMTHVGRESHTRGSKHLWVGSLDYCAVLGSICDVGQLDMWGCQPKTQRLEFGTHKRQYSLALLLRRTD